MVKLILSIFVTSTILFQTSYAKPQTKTDCQEFFYNTVHAWVEAEIVVSVGKAPNSLTYVAQTPNALMIVMATILPSPVPTSGTDVKSLGICTTPKAGDFKIFILSPKKV